MGWVNAQLSRKAQVYVAKKLVRPTEQILESNFDLRMADTLLPQNQAESLFTKGNFPVAVRARTSIMPGGVLSLKNIERLPLVQLGDVVTLILRSDNMKISTKGVVQSAAGAGEMVTVQLQRYSRTFRGKLNEGKTVEVWF